MSKEKKFYLLYVVLFLTSIVYIIIESNLVGQSSVIVCPSKLLFHIPCPACGSTRAMLLLIDGKVADALMMNPNVVILALVYIVSFVTVIIDLIRRETYLFKMYHCVMSKMKGGLLLAFFIFEAFIWIRNIYVGI